MRHLTYIFLLAIIWSCQEAEHQIIDPELKEFNSNLGQDKAAALDKAVSSFDSFLRTNFPDKADQQERALAFLQQINKDDWPDPNWIFQTENNKEILQEFETSGLRKEFRLYGYEDEPNVIEEEIIPIKQRGTIVEEPTVDSSAYFRVNGLFRISLAESIKTDSLTLKYVDARRTGNLSYDLLAEGLLTNDVNYSNPIHKRIMITDFYYDLMEWDIKRKE